MMAYMNVEKKNKLAPGIKKVLAEYGMKKRLGYQNNAQNVVYRKEMDQRAS